MDLPYKKKKTLKCADISESDIWCKIKPVLTISIHAVYALDFSETWFRGLFSTDPTADMTPESASGKHKIYFIITRNL